MKLGALRNVSFVWNTRGEYFSCTFNVYSWEKEGELFIIGIYLRVWGEENLCMWNGREVKRREEKRRLCKRLLLKTIFIPWPTCERALEGMGVNRGTV